MFQGKKTPTNHFHAFNLKSVINSSEINSTKQNKPVKGIILQCIRRQNAATNRFEVGLDLFKKYIICLQNQNVFQETKEASSMDLREQELLNQQFSRAAKLCGNNRNFSLPHFPLSFFAVFPPAQDLPGHISEPGSLLRFHHSPGSFLLPVLMHCQKSGPFFPMHSNFPVIPAPFMSCIITAVLMCK